MLGQMTRRGREEGPGATLRLHVTASPPEGGQREPAGWKKAAPGAVVATAGQRKRPLRAARQHGPALPCSSRELLPASERSDSFLSNEVTVPVAEALSVTLLSLSHWTKVQGHQLGPILPGLPRTLAPHTLSPAGQLGPGLPSRR